MTSVAHELASENPQHANYDSAAPGLACFRKEMAYRFCQAHGRRQRLVSATRLGIAPMPATCVAPPGAEPIKSFSSASLQAVTA
jgi:hypothetical protein